jgi:uncharacterized membrane protein YadS
MRIFSFLPVVLSFMFVVKSNIKSKRKEEQRSLPWYKREAFWSSTFFIVMLLQAILIWNIDY